MNKPPSDRRFVVCIKNDEFEFDLALHKIYQVMPDASAERSGWIRVVDDSGEDYLYPGDFFQAIEVSHPPSGEWLRAS